MTVPMNGLVSKCIMYDVGFVLLAAAIVSVSMKLDMSVYISPAPLYTQYNMN